MSSIVILDTSVYLNILDVPHNNQDRSTILEELKAKIENKDHFLLPLASILETGNHIADLENGGLRLKFGEKLVEDVSKAINGDAPYRPTQFPLREDFLTWLSEFPNYVKRNKNEYKTREGISLSDLTIIKEWEKSRRLFSMSRVLIWSLDSDLFGYDTN